MYDDRWRPRCTPPTNLVRPVPLDPTGRAGPTRHQARRGRWRRAAYNLYVPADTDRSVVEQRIMEQSARLGPGGAVTGWAALRMWGAAFFDGLAADVRTPLPVPLVGPTRLSSDRHSTASRAAVGRVWSVAGVPVVTPAPALYAEIIRREELRSAVAAIDMACAAPVTSLARFGAWLAARDRPRRLALDALALASERSASPPEVELRMVWLLDAHWPTPVVNHDVFDLQGRFLGRPDLLDPATGVYGEHDGEMHRTRARHRSDVDRADRLQRHGLEPFVVVAGDGADVQLQRMEAALDRARRRPAEDRRWTLDPPGGVPPPLGADDLLDHLNIPV